MADLKERLKKELQDLGLRNQYQINDHPFMFSAKDGSNILFGTVTGIEFDGDEIRIFVSNPRYGGNDALLKNIYCVPEAGDDQWYAYLEVEGLKEPDPTDQLACHEFSDRTCIPGDLEIF